VQRIQGAVLLPTPTQFSEATVVVRLLDVSILDIPAQVIAEARFTFSGGPTRRVPFELTFEASSMGAVRAALSAEIRIKDPERLRAGDWVTTQAAAVLLPEIMRGDSANVAVERIPEH
jgi:uncharacterized lipoprotein YbaY